MHAGRCARVASCSRRPRRGAAFAVARPMLSGAGMSFEYALGLVAAVALTGYLAVALVWPERF